jgi:putative membrane protein
MRGQIMRPDMMYGADHRWIAGLFMLLIVLALIAGAIIIVRMLTNRVTSATGPAAVAGPSGTTEATTPVQILEMRFARGEIDEEEFRRRRDVLRG